MRLDKVKRPGGTFSFEMVELDRDEYGTWLYGAKGAPWSAPNDCGVLPFTVAVLVHPTHWAVTWWVDDPADRRVEIDICLPPVRTGAGWAFVDLELDPTRHADGRVEVEDHGEFETACRDGWITAGDAEAALTVASTFEQHLHDAAEPWGRFGWRRLEDAQERVRMRD